MRQSCLLLQISFRQNFKTRKHGRVLFHLHKHSLLTIHKHNLKAGVNLILLIPFLIISLTHWVYKKYFAITMPVYVFPLPSEIECK
jgi:hypothetical protein